MCRWLAYCGEPIPLCELLSDPEHSLLQQSRQAIQTQYTVNGDGVGVGWYSAESPEPGLYRETRAAWNDENVDSLSRHVRSGLFLAHVRAVTRGAVARINTHPFRMGQWLFQHNGDVGGWDRVHQDLDQRIEAPYYAARQGQTDSESLFALAMSRGLQDDPAGALSRMVQEVEELRRAHDVAEPFRMSVAVTNGQSLWAARYSSNGDTPTLYWGRGLSLAGHDGEVYTLHEDSTVVVSEPLDMHQYNWQEVPDRGLMHVSNGDVSVSELEIA
ncbi:MAG: class II glutamine amidotransferase [Phycisphaerales bacterium]|nr:class II glutamine amidotransferase [Phycisphaerales bacterium]